CLVVAYYRLGLLHHVPSTDFPYTTLFRSQFLINDRDDEGLYIDLDLPENMPSAFVCNCDQVARNLIQKLNDMGYRVPDDCSVARSEEHTSELQSRFDLVCRLLLEKKIAAN